jgi:PAS domain-containing protein
MPAAGIAFPVPLRVRYTPAFAHEPVQELLEPRRIIRWGWGGRMSVATALLLAAVFVWREADPVDTLVATLAFATATLATVGGYLWAEGARPLGRGFLAVHFAVDLALVTLAVWLTGGWSSQFAALYILVISGATLVLSFQGGMLVALGACLLYGGVVLAQRPGWPEVGLLVQVTVFLAIGGGLGLLVHRLRLLQQGRSAFTQQLMTVQFEAADILRSIRSGILTIDPQGRLLYANPMASELLGLDLEPQMGRPVLRVLERIAPELAQLLVDSSRDRRRVARAEGVIVRDGGAVEVGMTTTVADGAPSNPGRGIASRNARPVGTVLLLEMKPITIFALPSL